MKNDYLGKIAKDKAAEVKKLKTENAALRGACQIYSEMVRNAYNEAYENRSCPLSCIEAFRGSRVGERMKVLENRLYGSQS